MKRPAARRPGPGHAFERGVCTRCGLGASDRRIRFRCTPGVTYRFDDESGQGRFDFRAAEWLDACDSIPTVLQRYSATVADANNKPKDQ